MNEININDLLKYIIRRWYFIVISIVLFLVGAFIYSEYIKVPVYESTTSLVLTKTNDSTVINQNDITMNQKLVYTYSELIKSKLVLNQVKDNLSLKMKISELSGEITVSSVDNTEMIKITVKDKDKQQSEKIANEIAKVFCHQVRKIYEINNVSIVDKAEVAKKPCNIHLGKDMAIAFILGIAVSGGILFIIFYFDDSIKLSDELEEELKIPVIGKIIKLKNDKKSSKYSKTELIVDKYPKSIVSEGIKSLRTNLAFSNIDTEMKTILVTSSVPGEGKSFTSTNLATAFAQTNMNVLLIDTDMRKGRLHRIFNISNEAGLSDLLVSKDYEETYSKFIKPSTVKKLHVLPCGTIPPNPSELLNSDKFRLLVEFLSTKYDLLIFDGVPCNGLPDSIIMSTLADKTIIVASEGTTPKALLKNTITSLNNVTANIGGIVLNKVNTSGSGYYYGKYYSYYGEEE